MPQCRRTLLPVFVSAVVLVIPSLAHAQWYVAGGFGANHTPPATIAIDQPSTETSLQFHHVTFSARPFSSPVYYVWRVGRHLGASGHLSLEFEFTHLKVIAQTAGTYQVTGELSGAAVSGPMEMDTFVQAYAMTHGLNFLLANVAWREPIGGPLALVVRGGAGPTVPHAETTVAGLHREQYQYAGIGGQVAAGIDVRMAGALSAFVDYKLTIAHPVIRIVNGTGALWAATSQVAAGLAFGFSR